MMVFEEGFPGLGMTYRPSSPLPSLIREECTCCYGTGVLSDIYDNEGACMTCNGKGYFEYEERAVKND